MLHTILRHGSRTIGAIICAYVAGASLLAQTPAKVDFARDIQPLFRDHCIECHGASQQMRGFRLDRRRDAMPNRVGANGVRIVPGNSAQSPLYRRVSARSSQMPALAALQRSDGGWSQTRTLASDAYATGQALVAIHEARAIATGTPAYRRGIQYLLNSQLEDGSWHVVTRAAALQPYFDSEFPHGPDQFISAAATNWASMALMTVVR